MIKGHTPEFSEIMNNYFNERENARKGLNKNIMTLIEERNREMLQNAKENDMLGLEKIHYDGLDNRAIANRVKYMKLEGSAVKKFKMQKLLNVLEDEDENLVTENTVDTKDMFVKRMENTKSKTNNQSKKTSVLNSKNSSLFDDYRDTSLLPSLVTSKDRKKIDILLASPKLRKTLLNNVSASVGPFVMPSDLNCSDFSINLNQQSHLSSHPINLKSVKSKSNINSGQIDYAKFLSRLVSNTGTSEVIRVIEKQRKVDRILGNIDEKSSRIKASSLAAFENMKRRKRREENLTKKYDKLQKERFDIQNFW